MNTVQMDVMSMKRDLFYGKRHGRWTYRSGYRIALKNNYLKGVIIYEEKAKTAWEKCGAPGRFEKNLPWILTLCAIHHYDLKGKNEVT